MFVFVLVPLIVLTCVFPGLTLVRRLRLSPLETLCASVGVSIALAYGWQMASLVCGRPVAMPYVWSAVALLAAVLTWRDARRLLGRRQVRGAVYATAGLGAFGLLAAAMVRHFSGGDWAGDWLEHHLRVGYFLAKVPREYLYANTYLLPARPPLQNAAAALFAAQVGYEFEVVQVTFAMFAATVMPAMLLVARDLVPRARVRWWVMLAMVVTTPCVAQNMTWTWPKLLTVTYVLTGIHFYLAGWRKEDGRRVTLAFGMLAAGCITHFSGAVFAVVIGVHYVAATLARRRWAWREWAASASVTLIVLASWFGYSAAVFGVKATVWSNSTLLREHDGQSLHENIVTLTGKHLLTTLVPAAARGEPGPATVFTWSRLRNAGFAMYQSNLLIMMGLVAGLTAVWLATRAIMRGVRAERGRRFEAVFWLMLAPGTTVLGVAVVPVRYDAYGVAHGCLLPLVLLGVAMVATAFATLPSWMRWLLVLSRGVDFAWGVLLQLVVEGYAFALAPPRTPGGYPVVIDPWGFERRVLLNFLERSVWNISYWGDRFVMMRDGLRILCGAVGATMTGLLGWAAMRTSRRPATDERRNWATAMTKPRQPLRKFPAARVS